MRTLRLAALAALLAVPLAAAQPPAPVPARPTAQPAAAPPPAPIPEQLAHLNATLEHISQLLERQLDGQKLDLLLRRVEIGNRRVTALEQELERAEGEKRSVEDGRYRLQFQIQAMRRQLDVLPSDPHDTNQSDLEAGIQNATNELRLSDLRIQQATQRVLDLQNELDGQKHDLQGLKDLLDRQLQGQ